MEKAVNAIGEKQARYRQMYLKHHGFMISYAVAKRDVTKYYRISYNGGLRFRKENGVSWRSRRSIGRTLRAGARL